MKPSVNHLTTPFRYLQQAKKLTLGSVSKPKLFVANGFLTTGLEKIPFGSPGRVDFLAGQVQVQMYDVHCNF